MVVQSVRSSPYITPTTTMRLRMISSFTVQGTSSSWIELFPLPVDNTTEGMNRTEYAYFKDLLCNMVERFSFGIGCELIR